jgi:hypothetical protein
MIGRDVLGEQLEVRGVWLYANYSSRVKCSGHEYGEESDVSPDIHNGSALSNRADQPCGVPFVIPNFVKYS